MGTPFLRRVAQAIPDAAAICTVHEAKLWSLSEYAAEVRQQSVYHAAVPDPCWNWPTAAELGRCVVVLFGDPAVAPGITSDDVPTLVAQLEHSDPCFRLDAISKLGALHAGAAEAAGAIGAVVANRRELPNIRKAAMEAGSGIWGMLSFPAARAIARVAWDAGEDMQLRRAAVEALSDISTNATTRELEDIALDDAVDVTLRTYAAEMIAAAEANNSRDALEELRDLLGKDIIAYALAGRSVADACSVYQGALVALEDVAPADDEGE